MEKEGFARITINGEAHEVHQGNASVFRHLGNAALYDHVFIVVNENDGAYIWRHNEAHEELEALASQNGCPLHLNLPEASDLDKTNYEKHVLADLSNTDGVPEGWE
jgi:hypothetical protein